MLMVACNSQMKGNQLAVFHRLGETEVMISGRKG